jgi:RHS repeat-associated protein
VKGTVGGVTTTYIGNYFEWTGSTSTMKKYYYAGTTRVAMRTGSGTGTTGINWLFGDHLGSQSSATDANGNNPAVVRYKAWGEDRYTSGTTPTSFRFTGQRWEPSLSIYFFGARWYDPSLGRFLSPDSIIPEASQGVQAWDRMAYTNNNPVRYTDPSGHCLLLCAAVGAVLGAVTGAAISAVSQAISTGNVDLGQVGKSAVIGAVSGAVVGGTFGLGTALLGSGLGASVGLGALSGALGGQASRATENVLSGQDVGEGLGNPVDIAKDAAFGAVTGAVGYSARRLIAGNIFQNATEVGAQKAAANPAGYLIGGDVSNINNPRVGLATFGKAVENATAKTINRSYASGLFEHVGGPNNVDFIGKGIFTGLEFDVTTNAQWANHMMRYGDKLIGGIYR